MPTVVEIAPGQAGDASDREAVGQAVQQAFAVGRAVLARLLVFHDPRADGPVAHAEQALQRAELNLRSARGFFDVGTHPRSDVTRAEVDVANARVDLIRARNAERFARVALNTAMGLSPDTPTQVQDNLVYQPTPLERERLVRDAIGARPESRQARLRAEEAEALLRRSERDFLPDVLAGGFYGASRSDFDAR